MIPSPGLLGPDTLTVLTLAATPIDPWNGNFTHVQHISSFDDAAGLHNARLDSIGRVETPYFSWVDADDPLPTFPDHVSAAVVYGPHERYVHGGILTTDQPRSWARNTHLCSPLLIHKAVCSTAAVRDVLPRVPRGEYYTELVLYFLLAHLHSWEISPGFVARWESAAGAMHTKVRRAIGNSLQFLLRFTK